MDHHWHNIQPLDSQRLQQARVQLHHAVQLPGMAGRSYLPAHPGDEYGNLGWSHTLGGFESHVFASGCQVALVFKSLELVLLKEGQIINNLPLKGLNLEQAVDQLRGLMTAQGLEGSQLNTQLPYTIPEFQADYQFKADDLETERLHLAHLFANSSIILDQLSAAYSGVSVIRCWPHHFDNAALMLLDDHPDPELQKSIGWGFSPGDEQHPDPYFYVNCWPHPEITNTPAIAYGKWNLQGWIGTTLSYRDFAGDPQQQEIVKEYFNSSTAGLQRLIQS